MKFSIHFLFIFKTYQNKILSTQVGWESIFDDQYLLFTLFWNRFYGLYCPSNNKPLSWDFNVKESRFLMHQLFKGKKPIWYTNTINLTTSEHVKKRIKLENFRVLCSTPVIFKTSAIIKLMISRPSNRFVGWNLVCTDWVSARGMSNEQNQFSYFSSVGRRRYRCGPQLGWG